MQSIRILLAEDTPFNLKMAKTLITKAGYQVEVAQNGKEAVDIYTKAPEEYDLIFMDVQMPEMDGIEATKKIREDGFHKIPIIAMTAHTDESIKEKCLEAGMNDFISKPIRKEIVSEVVEKWVSDKENQ